MSMTMSRSEHPMVADEMFTIFIEGLQGRRRDSWRRRRLAAEWTDRRRSVDAQLARERAYDAETDRLLAEMRRAKHV